MFKNKFWKYLLIASLVILLIFLITTGTFLYQFDALPH